MKKILYLILPFLLFFTLNINVDAAASLSSSASTVYKGNSFTVKVNLSGVAAWEVHVSASGPVSGCSINAADTTSDAQNGSKSYSATCKATGTGTIRVSLSGNTTTASGSKANISGSKSISAINKPTSNSSSNSSSSSGSSSKGSSSKSTTNNQINGKPSVNTLDSLSVEGLVISPTFEKNKTNYTLTVANDVESIKINAKASDSKAKVSGTGEKKLTEKENKFNIEVTAENGDKKTYELIVTVDSKPINVEIDGKTYTLIKKKEELPELAIEHEDLTLSIEEQDIPAYRIDKLNYVLVGLKDEEGNIKLYIFNSFKDNTKPFEYTLFRTFNFPEINISYLKFPESLIPKNYKLYKEKIGDEEIEVYKLSKSSNYSLFYGTNIETGEKNIYRYDSKEKTVQIYEREEAELMDKKINEGFYIFIGLIGLSAFLLLIIFILLITRKGLKKKTINNYKRQIQQKNIKEENIINKKQDHQK